MTDSEGPDRMPMGAARRACHAEHARINHCFEAVTHGCPAAVDGAGLMLRQRLLLEGPAHPPQGMPPPLLPQPARPSPAAVAAGRVLCWPASPTVLCCLGVVPWPSPCDLWTWDGMKILPTTSCCGSHTAHPTAASSSNPAWNEIQQGGGQGRTETFAQSSASTDASAQTASLPPARWFATHRTCFETPGVSACDKGGS